MLAPFSRALVGTTKVYPGVGADIVMESISRFDPETGILSANAIYRQSLFPIHHSYDSPAFHDAEGRNL
jgi:hypothetical protein